MPHDRLTCRWLTCRWLTVLVCLVCLLAGPARAALMFQVDQRYGSIGFAVGIAGMFAVEGRFPRFAGDLVLDLDHPDRSRIEMVIDIAAVEMPQEDQADLLRSDAYFDTAAHPQSRFVSTAVEPLSATRYLIHGLLSLRGVTRPQALEAELANRRIDPGRNLEVADFRVSGPISRSAFGMVADRSMVGDAVTLDIRIHLDMSLAPGQR